MRFFQRLQDLSRTFKTAQQTVNRDTITPVSWAGVNPNDYAAFDPAAPTQLRILRAGKYHVRAQVDFVDMQLSSAGAGQLRINGVGWVIHRQNPVGAGFNTTFELIGEGQLARGDLIDLAVDYSGASAPATLQLSFPSMFLSIAMFAGA